MRTTVASKPDGAPSFGFRRIL